MGDVSAELNDPPLSAVQVLAVSKLTASDIEQIDNELLANVVESWRKNAMVVGLVMIKMRNRFNDIPDLYYAQRLIRLVDLGLLESEGNILKIGRGEVRRVPCV